MKKLFILLTAIFAGMLVYANDVKQSETAKWREDFDKTVKKGELDIPAKWAVKGTKFGVPATRFYVEKDADDSEQKLVIKADKATGVLVTIPSDKVDLKKTPIMRWCWRVIKLPQKADGRKSGKDDQALAIYIGANGSFMTKKSLAYRWETETPKDHVGQSAYGAGMVKVKWYCLRNKEDGLNEWFTEERNVADDFKEAYGYIPSEFALSIAGNSQYTGSDSVAELKWIEFVPEKTDSKTQTAEQKTTDTMSNVAIVASALNKVKN